MTILIDDLGIWGNLGRLNASTDWQNFPLEALEGLSLFKIRFEGFDPLDPPLNRFYIRSIFNRVSNFVSPQWIRIYPSNEQLSLHLPYPEEFRNYRIGRWIQLKRGNYYKGYDEMICDNIYISIDEFVPNEINKQIQLNQVSIEAIAKAVIDAQNNIIP